MASWAYDLGSHTGPDGQNDLMFGFMLCDHGLEILTDFVFGLVFGKSKLIEQCSITLSRGDRCLMWHLSVPHRVWVMAMNREWWWTYFL